MKKLFLPLFLLLSVVLSAGAGDQRIPLNANWKLMRHTPEARLTQGSTALSLVNVSETLGYAAASIKVNVDLAKTPYLAVKTAPASAANGYFKLLARDRKVTLSQLSSPGLYVWNAAEQLKIKGPVKLELCLYAAGKNLPLVVSSIEFLAQDPTPPPPRFTLVPTFESCAYYFYSPDAGGVTPYFRRIGETVWHQGVAAERDGELGQYRGSVVRLTENTDYELELRNTAGLRLAGGKFTTWRDRVPVAKTVYLTTKDFADAPCVITAHGRPDGWIRYTAKPGTVLANNNQSSMIVLQNAQYVLLDGLTLQGGLQYVIEVKKSRFVRLQNCDISNWGRTGIQRPDVNGRFFPVGQAPQGYGINYDGAIYIAGGEGIVVERCYIHDPRNHANSWWYSHPAGPEAVLVNSPNSSVIRYNDFVGSDLHRFNDAVESSGNFSKDGGLNRDADVNGNYMIYCSDDNIELDGGQQNVRCYDNHFEGSYCGISLQGCMTGPSYVFNNLLCNMGDEFGLCGATVKTHSRFTGKFARSHLYNNTLAGSGGGTIVLPEHYLLLYNNVFAGERPLHNANHPNENDYNLFEAAKRDPHYGIHTNYGDPQFADAAKGNFILKKKTAGTRIPNFSERAELGASNDLPYRPLPVVTDRKRVAFTVKNGAAPAEFVTVTVGGKDFTGRFTIRKNHDFNWFTVTPNKGSLKSGETVTLKVQFSPQQPIDRVHCRGAFLIRFEDGLSRPVTVVAKTDFVQPVRPKMAAGEHAVYVDLTQPSRGMARPVVSVAGADRGVAANYSRGQFKGKNPLYKGPLNQVTEYDFDVPEDGLYFVLLRLCGKTGKQGIKTIYLALDSDPLVRLRGERNTPEWGNWLFFDPELRPGTRKRLECRAVKLKKGHHTLKLAANSAVYADLAVITSNPQRFERR